MNTEVIEGMEVCIALHINDEVRLMQHRDVELKVKINILQKKEEDRTRDEKDHTQDLQLDNNILYKKVGEKRLYVVPKSKHDAQIHSGESVMLQMFIVEDTRR